MILSFIARERDTFARIRITLRQDVVALELSAQRAMVLIFDANQPTASATLQGVWHRLAPTWKCVIIRTSGAGESQSGFYFVDTVAMSERSRKQSSLVCSVSIGTWKTRRSIGGDTQS